MGAFSEENVKCDSLTSSCIKDAGIIFENYVLENLYILCKKKICVIERNIIC